MTEKEVSLHHTSLISSFFVCFPTLKVGISTFCFKEKNNHLQQNGFDHEFTLLKQRLA